MKKGITESEQSLVRDGEEIYLIDDEGNRDFFKNLAGSDYEDDLPFDGASIFYSGMGYNPGGGYLSRTRGYRR
jgi:hypothetical protein